MSGILSLLLAGGAGATGLAGIWGLFRLVRLALLARRLLKEKEDTATPAARVETRPSAAETATSQPRQPQQPDSARQVVVGPRDVEYVPYPEICKSCKAWEMALSEFVRVEPGQSDAVQRIRAYYRQFLSGMK